MIKPVALADTGTNAGGWVGPAFVHASHPFAQVDGVTNILSVGRGASAVLFSGPGAGPGVTALTVLDDVVEAVAGRGPKPFRAPEAAAPVAQQLRTLRTGAWCLALDHVSSSAGELAEFLAANHLPAVALVSDHWRE